MSRFNMDDLIFVMNDSGVYHGHADIREEWNVQQKATREGRRCEGLRSWSLGYETRYDMWAEAVGGKGYCVRTKEELVKATEEGFKVNDRPVIVNVAMRSGKGSVEVFGFEIPPPKHRDAKL